MFILNFPSFLTKGSIVCMLLSLLMSPGHHSISGHSDCPYSFFFTAALCFTVGSLFKLLLHLGACLFYRNMKLFSNLYELACKTLLKTFLHSQIILVASKKKLKRWQNANMKWQEWMISQEYFISTKINVMCVFNSPSLLSHLLCFPADCI